MQPAEVKAAVFEALTSVAPEVDPSTLREEVPLRSQVDLDSIDWLNFLVRVHEKLHVEIPESDYAELVTLGDIVSYVLARGFPRGHT
jgi:acyl carrier protein